MSGQPPGSPLELAPIADPSVPPAGRLASFLGERIAPDTINNCFWSARDRRLRDAVRAFRVLPLIGAAFVIDDDRELAQALNKCLLNTLPGIGWAETSPSALPLRKYGIVHHSVDAPTDEATGQAMAIELFAELVELDGRSIDDQNRFPLMRARYRELIRAHEGKLDEVALLSIPIIERMTIKIRQATYANIRHPGVGVPFYL